MRLSAWIAGAISLFVALALPSAALAGGWSTVAADPLPPGIVAGSDLAIGFTALQHGRTPLSNERASITAMHESGERVTAEARPVGARGHYTATIRFSRPGAWSWSVDIFEGPHLMPPITVESAGAVTSGSDQPAGATTTIPADRGLGDLNFLTASGWIVAILLGIAAFARRRPALGPAIVTVPSSARPERS